MTGCSPWPVVLPRSVVDQSEHPRGTAVRAAHLQRRYEEPAAGGKLVQGGEVLEDDRAAGQQDVVQFVVDAVDRVGRGAVEADAGDPGLDKRGSGSGVRIAPAAPVGGGAPVRRVARAEQDDVVRSDLGEETAEHIKTDRAGQ